VAEHSVVRSERAGELAGLSERIAAVNVDDVGNAVVVDVVDELTRVDVHHVYHADAARRAGPSTTADSYQCRNLYIKALGVLIINWIAEFTVLLALTAYNLTTAPLRPKVTVDR